MLEDMTSSFSMEFRVGGGDEEVIHINDEPSFYDHVLEGVVHELLEHGRGVAKTEEHNSWFEESFVHDEGCFPLMTICHIHKNHVKFNSRALSSS